MFESIQVNYKIGFGWNESRWLKDLKFENIENISFDHFQFKKNAIWGFFNEGEEVAREGEKEEE